MFAFNFDGFPSYSYKDYYYLLNLKIKIIDQ